ncbi:MAG: ABC transporter substrate-binding protein, partial [Gammaproteobacteria bacterium]
MSVYQPVDVMDLTVNMGAWRRLSPKMQQFVEDQVRTYSVKHFVEIQKANMVAMTKFRESGCEVSRMGPDDIAKFRKAAIPIWFNWAKKDPDAARVFKLQLEYMKNDLLGYVTDEDLKGHSI